jgi:putative hemolysin
MEILTESTNYSEKKIVSLLQDKQRLIWTLLIGRVLCNACAIALIVFSSVSLSGYFEFNIIAGTLVGIFVYLIIYLTVSETVLKVIKIKSPKKFVIISLIPFLLFYYLFSPLTKILEKFARFLSAAFGLDKDKYLLSEEELRNIVDISEKGSALKKDERDMIHSIFEMSETVAREIMVPRIDMIGVEERTSITQLLKINKEKNHSRIPVYRESIDNIVGILHIKDLLPLIKRRITSDFDIMKLTNPPYFVPEQKKVNELLREFRTERIHLAIVVDEYGGTAGIVTLEDVIEEIVGEIQDEHDQETPQISQIDENTFLVSGSMLIDDLNDEFGFHLPEEEGIDTLAGFLLGQFGSVPKTKSTIAWNGYEFVIERVYRRRIERVRIIKIVDKLNSQE